MFNLLLVSFGLNSSMWLVTQSEQCGSNSGVNVEVQATAPRVPVQDGVCPSLPLPLPFCIGDGWTACHSPTYEDERCEDTVRWA